MNYSDEKKLNIDTIELLKVTSTQAGVDWIELEWIYENDNVDFYQISCSHNGITIDYRIEGMDLSEIISFWEIFRNLAEIDRFLGSQIKIHRFA